MEIKRDRYLNTLISKEHNGLIKVVTGMRRCGKSVPQELHINGHHIKIE
jgi:predicted AAA+ superfamily ATPase